MGFCRAGWLGFPSANRSPNTRSGGLRAILGPQGRTVWDSGNQYLNVPALLCASFTGQQPRWLPGRGGGWATATRSPGAPAPISDASLTGLCPDLHPSPPRLTPAERRQFPSGSGQVPLAGTASFPSSPAPLSLFCLLQTQAGFH